MSFLLLMHEMLPFAFAPVRRRWARARAWEGPPVPGCGRADAGFSSLTTRTAADGLEKCNSAFKVYIRAPLGPKSPLRVRECPFGTFGARKRPVRARNGPFGPERGSRARCSSSTASRTRNAFFGLDGAQRGSNVNFPARKAPLGPEGAVSGPKSVFGPEGSLWNAKGPEGHLSGQKMFFGAQRGPKGFSRARKIFFRARRGPLGL